MKRRIKVLALTKDGYEDEVYLFTGVVENKINYEKEILEILNKATNEEKEYIYHLIKIEYIKNSAKGI